MNYEYKIIIGLVGYRCCGKSTLRDILKELEYPVFNTNSVRTGDADANRISLEEILKRYGKNKSYLFFLEKALKDFFNNHNNIVFIDSFKVSSDIQTIKEFFPFHAINIWYLHASFPTRQQRYIERDIKTNLRSQNLLEHDKALEEHGIWELIKSAKEIINMELDITIIKKQVEEILVRTKNEYDKFIRAEL